MRIRWIRTALVAWRRHCAAYESEVRKLAVMHVESERLRAELSHLEHEIYGIRESGLPIRHKALLEAAIRIRFRRVEAEMLSRQNEILASGHLPKFW